MSEVASAIFAVVVGDCVGRLRYAGWEDFGQAGSGRFDTVLLPTLDRRSPIFVTSPDRRMPFGHSRRRPITRRAAIIPPRK